MRDYDKQTDSNSNTPSKTSRNGQGQLPSLKTVICIDKLRDFEGIDFVCLNQFIELFVEETETPKNFQQVIHHLKQKNKLHFVKKRLNQFELIQLKEYAIIII